MKTNASKWPRSYNIALMVLALCACPQAKAANTLLVESYADNLFNPFTLRTKLSQANDGDFIEFSPALIGFTINLLNGELVINKNVTITGLGATKLSIVNTNGRVFHVKLLQQVNPPPVSALISGLRLHGEVTGANGADGTIPSPSGGSAPQV